MDIDVAGLPKVELHLHLEGTLEPELAFELAARNGVALAHADVGALRAAYDFANLEHFLGVYYGNVAVLRTAEDFGDLTTAYLRRAVEAGVRHVEVFFDPQAHLARQVPLEAPLEGITEALRAAERDLDVTGGLIAAFLRDRPVDEALATLEAIVATGHPLLGVGLDSAEAGHPPAPFRPVFDLARAHGLRAVAHAGEEGPPSHVWDALDILGVERVDHGVRSLEDEALVDRLVAEAVPLTVCPLSNVRLGVVGSLGEHPILAMLERGLHVTVNSDDPAYFGGYVDDNYRQLVEAFDLDAAVVARLARNGVRAAWLDQARRGALLAEVDRWEAAQP